MTLYRHRSLRILAAVFCSIGVLAGVDHGSVTWTLLAFVAFSSAVMLAALLGGASPVPAKLRPRVEVTR